MRYSGEQHVGPSDTQAVGMVVGQSDPCTILHHPLLKHNNLVSDGAGDPSAISLYQVLLLSGSAYQGQW